MDFLKHGYDPFVTCRLLYPTRRDAETAIEILPAEVVLDDINWKDGRWVGPKSKRLKEGRPI